MAVGRKMHEFSKRMKKTFLSIILLFIASTKLILVQISLQALSLHFFASL